MTAGVAHEIRNPLNFVKNFAESSDELLEELLEAIVDPEPADDQADYITEITGDLKQNLNRIRSHGERANRIVESMLMMGRGGGESRPVEINALLDEHAMLSYHSARAQDSDFNVTIERDFDPGVGELQVIPQDMGRVFLNLVTNAGYAANQRWRELGGEPGKMVTMGDGDDTPYFPTIWLSTRRTDESAVISVRDNAPASRPMSRSGSLNRSSPPSPPTRARGWDWRCQTTSCEVTAVRSRWTASRASTPSSPWNCRSSRWSGPRQRTPPRRPDPSEPISSRPGRDLPTRAAAGSRRHSASARSSSNSPPSSRVR